MEGQVVKSLACSPLEAGVLYAGTKPPLIFISRDHGRSWTELEAFRRMHRWWWRQPAEWPSTTYIQAIALSPTDPNLIMVGVEACGVFRSADSGQSWAGHVKGSVRDCHTLTFRPSNGMAYALLTDPESPGHVYAGLSNGDVWQSADYGDSWQQLSFNLGRIGRSMIIMEESQAKKST